MEVPIAALLLLAASTLALSAAPALAQVKPGEPPITALTEASGGPIEPERAALRLEHVDLAIEVFPETRRLAGTATLALTTSAPQRRLLIDLDKNLPVSAISVDGAPLPRTNWSNPEGRLAITLIRPLAAGARAVVKIVYGGTPHVAVRAPWDDGMVWSKTPEGQPWIATTAQGYGCDLFWPCLDFPAGEPAKVDLHITVPKGLSAPSNGVLQKVDTRADGRTTWHWRANSPNPYSVALNVAPYVEMKGSYKSRFGNTIPLYYWYLPGREEKAKGLFAEFAPVVEFFESNVGPYPWSDEKLGVVETPHLGMEHQTINAYGNNYRKTADGFDWLFQHELAHEWFGNQMSVSNWDDFWLHEGYGQYMQPLYGRWREGEARYAAMMEVFRNQITNQAPIVSGEVRTSDDVYEADKGGPGGDIYVKGAWVLHTLRNLIGDKAFKEVTTRLVYGRPDPKPGNFQPRFATTPEYIRIVNQVTGKDLTWFFDVYLREAALPELLQTREGDRLTLRWKTPKDKPFPLPVEVQIDGKVETVAMSGGAASIAVPADAHVVLDPASRILKRSEAVEAAQRDPHRGQ
ncbi:M1 family metallopeptidase [Sphingomonas sp. DG1-23]|uniref:M1 family metallopeptidase n=1 Tax=Sphingomonas sp. DG1-23 TaxID=3068316 RepID=UPI00273D4D9B|nr:M1 family metallopeptidase [Sphingomonas sp. DG1-23]MDP5277900.1 M1 family metallopeptidase [Sphingomonas sp. DG1-23]